MTDTDRFAMTFTDMRKPIFFTRCEAEKIAAQHGFETSELEPDTFAELTDENGEKFGYVSNLKKHDCVFQIHFHFDTVANRLESHGSWHVVPRRSPEVLASLCGGRLIEYAGTYKDHTIYCDEEGLLEQNGREFLFCTLFKFRGIEKGFEIAGDVVFVGNTENGGSTSCSLDPDDMLSQIHSTTVYRVG